MEFLQKPETQTIINLSIFIAYQSQKSPRPRDTCFHSASRRDVESITELAKWRQLRVRSFDFLSIDRVSRRVIEIQVIEQSVWVSQPRENRNPIWTNASRPAKSMLFSAAECHLFHLLLDFIARVPRQSVSNGHRWFQTARLVWYFRQVAPEGQRNAGEKGTHDSKARSFLFNSRIRIARTHESESETHHGNG